jgi:hypothetical protein
MNAALLALSITCTNSVISLRCVCPAVGSYSVQGSSDMASWAVLASGRGIAGTHVSFTDKSGAACRFYRVEWR